MNNNAGFIIYFPVIPKFIVSITESNLWITMRIFEKLLLFFLQSSGSDRIGVWIEVLFSGFFLSFFGA